MSIRVRDVVVAYSSAGYVTRPLDGLSFEAEGGELVLVLGASGCGKTSLLSVLGGILKPSSGEVSVDGTNVMSLSGAALTRYRRRQVGFVFQSFNLVPSLSALQNVAAPLRFAGVRGAEATRRASALLDQVNLGHRAHHRPGAMSGGEQQRVAIARSLVHDARVLLADEPTAHLDFIQVEAVVRLLRDLAGGHRTVVVATHDHRLLPVADRVVDLTPEQGWMTPASDAPVDLEPEDVLFRQGESSDFVYVVLAGSVDVVRERADGRSERLATVTQGQYVGELGPLLGVPRSATTRAGSRGAQLRRLAASEFRAAATGDMGASPRPLRRVAGAVRARR